MKEMRRWQGLFVVIMSDMLQYVCLVIVCSDKNLEMLSTSM